MIESNVRYKVTSKKENEDIIKNMIILGWDSIIWNNIVINKLTNQNYKLMREVLLEPIEMKSCLKLRSIIKQDGILKIKQFNRITIIIDDVNDLQLLNNNNQLLKSYDIISVCPGNINVFALLCKTACIDIISIDFTHKVPFPLNKKLLDEAIARGIHFEISYSPMLTISKIRKDIISGTKILIQFLRGKNIILSSSIDNSINIRGPYDIINIGEILNLTAEQAKNAISKNVLALLSHAHARRLKFIPIEIISIDEVKERYIIV